MRRNLIIVIIIVTALFLIQSQTTGQRRNRTRAQRAGAAVPASQQAADLNARNQLARALTRQEKAELTERLSSSLQLAARFRDQRYRVLSVALAPNDKGETVQTADRRLARAVIFNYTQGRATRLLVDASSAEILAEEPLRGRPQSSEEEIREAINIVRQDRELSRALQDGSVFEGGFIVDGPAGSPPNHRFIQLQVLTPDRLRFQRVVVVDLTAGTVAQSRSGN
ncbi:MAG TPA: hypothetical protein VJT09_18615 [Pyrinomonadaceae bacterium]|nr:hypothetical protein [Pyrinomonadaceae bacterium]